VILILSTSVSYIDAGAVSASAEIVNDRLWLDPNSIIHVLGEVRNVGDVWLRDIVITAAMWNVDGLEVGAVSGPASATFLPPGGVIPFDIARDVITTTDPEWIPIRHTAVIQSWTVLPGEVSNALAIVNVQHRENALKLFEVTGQIENKGDTPSRGTRIIGTFYEAGNDVIYVASVPAVPGVISPGTRSEQFNLTVSDEGASKRVTQFALLAESQDYSSVSETPWPIILVSVALAATLLALKKKSRKLT
jgi:hypothetical protein